MRGVKVFFEIFSRMASNSQKSRKFRPAKYKRYTVVLTVFLTDLQPALNSSEVCTQSHTLCTVFSQRSKLKRGVKQGVNKLKRGVIS